MLTRNINIQKGLCNGTKYEMTNLKPHVIEAKIFTEKNVEIFIPRIKFQTNPNVDSICLERQQFTVRLAFSITTNKAQEQTLKKVGIYIDSPLFAHGH